MNFENRINRWKKLYEPNPTKREVRFLIDYPNPDNAMPILSAENKQLRIDWAKRLYEWQIRNAESYEDDYLPHLNPLTGTEIIAEAFGCEVRYPENSMPFALPLVFDSVAASKIKVPKLEDTPLMLLFEIMDELKRFAGDDVLIRLPDMQGPMASTLLIWDKNDIFLAMYEEPEAVLELARKVKELFVAFADEWFKRYGHTQYVAHYPAYYMEGGITMSACDIGSFSPEMYRDFFAGELDELSQRYGGIGIHSCADSINHWGDLRQIDGLKLLNLSPHTEEQFFQAFEFFKDTCAQMHYRFLSERSNITPDDLEKFPANCRVVLPLAADNLDHAKQLADIYGKYR